MNLRFHLLNLFFISISFSTVAQTEIHRDSATVPGIDTAQNKVFEKVDIQATFPGGEVAWRKFLERHLWAEVAVQNRAPVGIYTVWVQFMVDTNGNVSNIRALTKNGYGMEEEVIRIMKKSPQWTPASQNGKLVTAYRKQPVTFSVSISR
jgi:protein TonB